jgi:hypothetical protein
MSAFATTVVTTDVSQANPTKHVLYQLGMVLGVDDFNQEFAYLAHRDHMTARELGGYGTVTGLRVGYDVDPRGPRIVVEPGIALSPRGWFIRVGTSQCAYLNDWLLDHKDEVRLRQIVAGGPLRLYVVLCYRDCPTDQVPIPGEPCRTEEDSMQPSRLTDDFTLELRWQAPRQAEDNAVRGFVRWLRRIEPSSGVQALSLADFEAELRADIAAILGYVCGADEIDSPPSSPPSSPPHEVPAHPILVPAGHECAYLRAAFRIWTTEIRPRVHPDLVTVRGGCEDTSSSTASPEEGCLLLAELNVPVQPFGSVFTVDTRTRVEVNEDCRPCLPSIRLLLEYLTCGMHEAGAQLQPGSVTPALSFGLPSKDGISDRYSRADHSHGTPPLPNLKGDANGPIGKNVVSHLLGKLIRYPVAGPANGELLTYVTDHWEPQAPPNLAGDANGPATNTVVSRLLGLDVRYPVNPPGNREVLTFVTDHWEPQPLLPPPPPPRQIIVAAGRFDPDGNRIGIPLGGLTANLVTANRAAAFYVLKPTEFNQDGFIVKGTVVTFVGDPIHTLEVVQLEDPAIIIRYFTANKSLKGEKTPARIVELLRDGVPIRISVPAAEVPQGDANPLAVRGFFVEVSRIS